MPQHLLDLRKLIESKRGSGSSKLHVRPFLYVTAVDLIFQIAIGMSNLHKLGILHRGIRAANVLVTHVTPNKKLYAVAVADFDGDKSVVGSGFWRAPEVLKLLANDVHTPDIPFTSACDVYSFAMTCYEILTGNLPFDGKPVSDYGIVVLSKERPKLPEDLPQEMASLITSCWDQEPEKRPKCDEILQTLREMIRQSPELKPLQVRFDLADALSMSSDNADSTTSTSAQPALSAKELLKSLKDELNVLEQENETQAVRLGNELVDLYENYEKQFYLANVWIPRRFWEKVPVMLRLIMKGNEFVNSLPDNGTNTVKTLAIWSRLFMPLVHVTGLEPILRAYVRNCSDAVLNSLRDSTVSVVDQLRSMTENLQVYVNKSIRASTNACRLRFARSTIMRVM